MLTKSFNLILRNIRMLANTWPMLCVMRYQKSGAVCGTSAPDTLTACVSARGRLQKIGSVRNGSPNGRSSASGLRSVAFAIDSSNTISVSEPIASHCA